jgi:hypothetical protein
MSLFPNEYNLSSGDSVSSFESSSRLTTPDKGSEKRIKTISFRSCIYSILIEAIIVSTQTKNGSMSFFKVWVDRMTVGFEHDVTQKRTFCHCL